MFFLYDLFSHFYTCSIILRDTVGFFFPAPAPELLFPQAFSITESKNITTASFLQKKANMKCQLEVSAAVCSLRIEYFLWK